MGASRVARRRHPLSGILVLTHDASHNPQDCHDAQALPSPPSGAAAVESHGDVIAAVLAPSSEVQMLAELQPHEAAELPSLGGAHWPFTPFQRPRIWTALAAAILALPISWVVSVVAAMLVLAVTVGPEAFRSGAAFSAETKQLSNTPLGLVVMALPGQLTFLACAFGAAALSPVPWRKRLKLERGVYPYWTWPLLAGGTPVVAFATSLTLGLFMKEPSEHMLWMEQMFRQQPLSVLPLLLLLIGVLPGLAEELLYRGYVQNRLCQAWPAAISILLTAVIFGIAHVDPTHALHVIPLGIWLGVLAWRTESLWPAILGHAANNSLALVMLRMIDRSTTPPTVNPAVGFLVLGAMGSFAVGVVLLIVAGRPLSWRDIFSSPRR